MCIHADLFFSFSRKHSVFERNIATEEGEAKRRTEEQHVDERTGLVRGAEKGTSMRADQGYTRAPPLRHPSSCLYARALSVHAHTRSSLGRIIHYRVHVMLQAYYVHENSGLGQVSSDNVEECGLKRRD